MMSSVPEGDCSHVCYNKRTNLCWGFSVSVYMLHIEERLTTVARGLDVEPASQNWCTGDTRHPWLGPHSAGPGPRWPNHRRPCVGRKESAGLCIT